MILFRVYLQELNSNTEKSVEITGKGIDDISEKCIMTL